MQIYRFPRFRQRRTACQCDGQCRSNDPSSYGACGNKSEGAESASQQKRVSEKIAGPGQAAQLSPSQAGEDEDSQVCEREKFSEKGENFRDKAA